LVNLQSPRCERCEGTRFFHVQRAKDAASSWTWERGAARTWRDRPVGTENLLHPRDGEDRIPAGHFDMLVCRGCGLTVWYAKDRQEIVAPETRGACRECRVDTTHLAIAAVEHGENGKLEEVRITHGMLGREGYLFLSVCTDCDRAEWIGRGYAHLDLKNFVAYELREERDRRCLVCGASAALVDERVTEHERNPIPIAIIERSSLYGLIRRAQIVGHFALRLCRPCGAVEWYARDFATLAHDPAHGIFAIGSPAPVASVEGPYR
jgi:predicted nucleic-acid-binding Zn-ribbon protein